MGRVALKCFVILLRCIFLPRTLQYFFLLKSPLTMPSAWQLGLFKSLRFVKAIWIRLKSVYRS